MDIPSTNTLHTKRCCSSFLDFVVAKIKCLFFFSSVCWGRPRGRIGSCLTVWGYQRIHASFLCWPVHGGTDHSVKKLLLTFKKKRNFSLVFLLAWNGTRFIYSLTWRLWPLRTLTVCLRRSLTLRGIWGCCWVFMLHICPKALHCPLWKLNVPVSWNFFFLFFGQCYKCLNIYLFLNICPDIHSSWAWN